MKKMMLIFYAVFSIKNVFSQCLDNKNAFIDYFDKNNLDPIEGLWSLNCITTFYFNGQKVNEVNNPVYSKWAIKRSSVLSFKVCDIGEGAYNNEAADFEADFEKTAIDGYYTYKCNYFNPAWVAKANVELSEGVVLDYGFNIPDFNLKKMLGQYYQYGYTGQWHFIWTKIYPLNSRTNPNNNVSKESEWKGNGSGFFIDKNGYIATNYHVIEDAAEIQVDVIKDNQNQSFKAKVVSSDKQNDLAIIKIEDSDFKPYQKLPYSFKTSPSDVATNVFALGYPMALSLMGKEIKFTDGKISAKTGFQGDITTYQISVPVQPGNSGGPLFDYNGNIIGIVNAKITSADNVSYAIKLTYLNNLIDVTPDKLILPNDQSISQKILTEKIKILSGYVVLIKIK